MTDDERRTEDWRTLPWKQYQQNVYRLQKRIYQAARRGDWKRVHNLQRLLLRSWSARCLAVRQVTQDNRGKRTPDVDGVASLTPQERLAYARQLRYLSRWTVDPIRRRDPTKPKRVIRLLKQQHGRCGRCGLRFTAEDVLEVHHQDGNHHNHRLANLMLLHAHCHDAAHGKQYQ
jgi:5-methylcytosine-specific restriction endonuclease McrA